MPIKIDAQTIAAIGKLLNSRAGLAATLALILYLFLSPVLVSVQAIPGKMDKLIAEMETMHEQILTCLNNHQNQSE